MSVHLILNSFMDHFWMEVGLRIAWFAAPVATTALLGLLMTFFLMHRMGHAHQIGLKFSTSGLGHPDTEKSIQTQKLPSLWLALFLAVSMGGFGLFYLSIMAGLVLSSLMVIGLALTLVSLKAGMAVEGVLWGVSVITAYWSWRKQLDGLWYRVAN